MKGEEPLRSLPALQALSCGNDSHVPCNGQGVAACSRHTVDGHRAAGHIHRQHVAGIETRAVSQNRRTADNGHRGVRALRDGQRIGVDRDEAVMRGHGVEERRNVSFVQRSVHDERLFALARLREDVSRRDARVGELLPVRIGSVVLRRIGLVGNGEAPLVVLLTRGFLSALLRHYSAAQHIYSPFPSGVAVSWRDYIFSPSMRCP